MKKIFLLFLIIISFVTLKAQVDTSTVEQSFESILEDASAEKDDNEIYDIIEYLSQNPIPLNTSSINDLLQIPFLNRISAAAIIRHRNLLGGIYSIDQLRNIEGVSFEVIEKILPFLKLGEDESTSIAGFLKKGLELIDISFRSRGIYDIQENKGYSTGKYEGSRWKIYNRFILSTENKIRFGALIEKDAGEKSISDFSTFHFQVRDLYLIKNLVLGDYLFEFGQGLALWSRYAFSKGSDAVGPLPRNSRGLVPYLSSDENQFLKGAAAVLDYSIFFFSVFYSTRYLDASIDSTTNEIASLSVDGLHRTPSEIRKKDKAKENLFGASLQFTFTELGNLGILYYRQKFSNNFKKNSLLDPTGNEFDFFSSSYSFALNKLNISGETAFSQKTFATLNSAEIAIDKNIAVVFAYRNYSQNYWNIHSSGFGERDFAQNETGFYTGLRLRTIYGTLNFYYDQFKFFTVSDKFKFPAAGDDFLIYYTYKPYKNTELRLQYKNKKKQILETDKYVYSLGSNRKQNIRSEFHYKVSKNLQLRSRIEYVLVTASNVSSSDKGFLLFQDLRFNPFQNLSLSARAIFFQTDSYNSRVYEFENDLTGVMTNPALYGEGMRWYIVARYNTPYGLTFSLKYSELYKPNERTLGSGYSEIPGNLNNRLSLQLDVKL